MNLQLPHLRASHATVGILVLTLCLAQNALCAFNATTHAGIRSSLNGAVSRADPPSTAPYELVQCPGTTDPECKCPQTLGYYCEPGWYCPVQPISGKDANEECTGGMFCPENSAQSIYCCPGHYCPSTTEIYVCPAGHFCHTGLMEPTKCAPLSNCPEGSSQENRIGSLVVFLIIAAVILIGYHIAQYWNRIRQNRKIQGIQESKKRRIEAKKSMIMNLENKDTTYTITFRELGLTLPNGRQIMNGVNGELLPNQVTAVMGPSGAGKTTFLSLISGKVKKTKGTISINGKTEPNGVSPYKKLVGFVPQEDVMLRTMTVKENLFFSAQYRLPASYTMEQISKRVHEVLDILGLIDIMYSVIGDERKRGISGGQRKRVNIGMELVADPSILFLDEPTSGLDSTSSEEVCKCLSKVSRLGLTIATVIHQPRYEIFAMFDRALLLGKGGRTVYEGPCNKALAYFTRLGFILPPHSNPADFYMDIISGAAPKYSKIPFTSEDIGTLTVKQTVILFVHNKCPISIADEVTNRELTTKRLSEMPETEIRSIFKANAHYVIDILKNPGKYTFVQEETEFAKEQLFELWDRSSGLFSQDTNYDFWSSFYLEIPFLTDLYVDIKAWVVETYTDIKELFQTETLRKTPGFGAQFVLCLKRAILQTYRDYNRLFLDNMLHLFAGLFLGIASRSLEYIGPLSDNLQILCPFELLRRAKCYMPLEDNFTQSGNLMTWAIGFVGIAGGSGTFGNEKIVYWRDASSGLNTFSYYLAKIICDLPRMMFASSCFFFAYILAFSIAGNTGELFLLILALYWSGFSCGYVISQLVHVEMAPLVGVAFALVWSVVFSGTNPRLPEVPQDYGENAMFFWDISYARWGIEAFYLINIKPFDHMKVERALDAWGYHLNNYGNCIARIFGIGLMWQVIGFLLIVFRYKDKKK